MTTTIMEFYGVSPILHFRNGSKRVNIIFGYIPINRSEGALPQFGYHAYWERVNMYFRRIAPSISVSALVLVMLISDNGAEGHDVGGILLDAGAWSREC